MIAKTFAPEYGAKPFVIMKHRDVERGSRRVALSTASLSENIRYYRSV
jgi:acyl-CoA synthetase (NDP forming)